MPYRDKELQKQKQRELMQKKRHVNPEPCEPKDVNLIVNPETVMVVNPPDPNDWSDRRNYSPAYLAALDAQGGKLTEASRVAMKGMTMIKGELVRVGEVKHPFMYFGSEAKPVNEKKLRKAKAVLEACSL